MRPSHDGSLLAVAMGAEYKTIVYPVAGGEPRPVSGLASGDVPVAWSDDNRFLYCAHLGAAPVNIFRVELATGRRTPWKQLVPPNPIGVTFIGGIYLAPT
jgi:hypothetical protein